MYNQLYYKEDISQYSFLIKGDSGFIDANLDSYLLKHNAKKVRVLDNLATRFLNMLVAQKESTSVKRIVYAASSSTYGDGEKFPKTEDKIGNPLPPYAVTKLDNELYADSLAHIDKAKALLDYQPKFSLTGRLKITWNYFK